MKNKTYEEGLRDGRKIMKETILLILPIEKPVAGFLTEGTAKDMLEEAIKEAETEGYNKGVVECYEEIENIRI